MPARSAAAEVSRDFDWIRVRGTALFASGDRNPADGRSQSFQNLFPSNHEPLGLIDDLVSGQCAIEESDLVDLSLETRNTVAYAADGEISGPRPVSDFGIEFDFGPEVTVKIELETRAVAYESNRRPRPSSALLMRPVEPKSSAQPSVRATTEISSGPRMTSRKMPRHGVFMRFRM